MLNIYTQHNVCYMIPLSLPLIFLNEPNHKTQNGNLLKQEFTSCRYMCRTKVENYKIVFFLSIENIFFSFYRILFWGFCTLLYCFCPLSWNLLSSIYKNSCSQCCSSKLELKCKAIKNNWIPSIHNVADNELICNVKYELNSMNLKMFTVRPMFANVIILMGGEKIRACCHRMYNCRGSLINSWWRIKEIESYFLRFIQTWCRRVRGRISK